MAKATKRQGEHPFYCDKKGVRKSAWDTPEHLLDSDRDLLKSLVNVRDYETFRQTVYGSALEATRPIGNDEAFFYRITGWAEGRSYMRDFAYGEWAYPMVRRMIERAAIALGYMEPQPMAA